jgi:hypothetical protein
MQMAGTPQEAKQRAVEADQNEKENEKCLK